MLVISVLFPMLPTSGRSGNLIKSPTPRYMPVNPPATTFTQILIITRLWSPLYPSVGGPHTAHLLLSPSLLSGSSFQTIHKVSLTSSSLHCREPLAIPNNSKWFKFLLQSIKDITSITNSVYWENAKCRQIGMFPFKYMENSKYWY